MDYCRSGLDLSCISFIYRPYFGRGFKRARSTKYNISSHTGSCHLCGNMDRNPQVNKKYLASVRCATARCEHRQYETARACNSCHGDPSNDLIDFYFTPQNNETFIQTAITDNLAGAMEIP